MSEDDSNSNRRIGRRQTLKLLGGGTLVGTGAATTATALTPTTKEVPELLANDRVVEYMEVPEDWLQHRNHARRAKDRFLDEYDGTAGLFSVGLVGTDETYGGKGGLGIRVQIDSDRVPGARRYPDLPSSFEDIPVVVEQAPESHGAAGCYNTGNGKDAAGGDQVGWANGGFGTANSVVYRDPNGSQEEQLLHCAHVFYSDCDDAKSGGITGRTVAASGTEIGEVVTYDRKGDYVLVDDVEADNGNAEDTTWLGYIDDNTDFPYVGGRVGQTAIDSYASNSDDPTIYNMGVTTGLTTGEIVSSDLSSTFTCYNFRDEGVEATTNFANGDSGGPTFLIRNGDAFVVSVSSYRYYDRKEIDGCDSDTDKENTMGNAVGTAGYYIQNNENIAFEV